MDLCHGMSLEFQLYLDYVRKLSFTEWLDYELLKGMFREVCFFFSLWVLGYICRLWFKFTHFPLGHG